MNADSTLLFEERCLVRGLMSDAECAFFERLVVETVNAGAASSRSPASSGQGLDGVICTAMELGLSPVPALDAGGDLHVMLKASSETGAGHDSVQMIDSTIIRAHQHPAGAKKRDRDQSLGRSRGGFSTKIHLRSTALGLPVAVTMSGGQVSDVKGYAPVLDEPGRWPCVILADSGYDGDFILADLEARGVAAVIPANQNHKIEPIIDGHIYRLRNLVECCFPKLKHNRRLATRYDKTANSFLGFVIVASIGLWIRHFVTSH